MTEFTLSKRKTLLFPEHVESADGKHYPIHPGHQTILRIFRLLQDETIAEHHRIAKACDLFYADEEPPDAFKQLLVFLSNGEEPDIPDGDTKQHTAHGTKVLDFEFDAPELYASFLHVYQIDLLECDLHWLRFGVLLRSLLRMEDTPISHKLHLRTMDTSHLKGRAKQKAEAAKRAVAIPDKVSTYDRMMEQKLLDAIQNGENPAQILKEWK